MSMTIRFAILSFFLAIPIVSVAETLRPSYPQAAHQIIIETEDYEKYNELANSIGFEIERTYSYTEYADINRANDTGTAGNYDFLLLSTGGNAWDGDAYNKFTKQRCGWETTYYSNHDLTVIHEVCKDQTATRAWVRILKVAEGRRPDLYKE